MTYTNEKLIEQEIGEQYDANSIPNSETISNWIEEVEAEIDLITGTSFTTNTTTDEYHDYTDNQNYFVVKNRPLLSVTSLAYNENGLGESPSWVTLTEGEANDFLVYEDQSRIRIHSNNYSIPYGHKNIKITYTWGMSSVPKTIQKVATLMVVERILDMKVKEFKNKSPMGMTIGEISIMSNYNDIISQKNTYLKDINRIFGNHGTLKVALDMWNE